MFDATLTALRSRGWRVQVAHPSHNLPPAISSRYPGLAGSSLQSFLCALDFCTNPDETAWFLTAPELAGSTDSAFSWNEFEQLSLQAAAGDSTQSDAVRAFWDRHFPFFLSVRSSYAYLAIRLLPNELGSVVSGCEPEFEDATVIASSFDDLLHLFAASDSAELKRLL